MIEIAVLGATGRMGMTLTRLLADEAGLRLAGAATEPGHELVGRDAGEIAGIGQVGVTVTDDVASAVAGCRVAIDFTLPAALQANLNACAQEGVAMVVGTTGLTDEQLATLDDAGGRIAVVYGRNMSVGVNVLTELVRRASRILGTEYDAEITEAHHRDKLDAPSGTALQLGESVAQGRGQALSDVAIYDRHSAKVARTAGSIGFASVRAGSIVGDHSVLLASAEEIIELKHRAVDRAVFARGALRAAHWVAEQPPGHYSMNDVLGLDRP
jgi:4-hydroxy-tetrahydrodipicolinate reductase